MRFSFRGAIVALALLSSVSALAMPLGLRTAMWHVSSANNRSSVSRLLPADCAEADIPSILESFADFSLGGYITNKTEYADFREWALNSGASGAELTSTQMAWISFALNAAGLVDAVKSGDLKIDSIEPSGNGGRLEVVFSLANARVGASAVEARLNTVFSLEGSTELGQNTFSQENLAVSLVPTADGRIKASVSPKGSPSSFFIHVKVK